MSRDVVTVHVGPYAEFLLPKERVGNSDKLDEALESGDLNHNLGTRKKSSSMVSSSIEPATRRSSAATPGRS